MGELVGLGVAERTDGASDLRAAVAARIGAHTRAELIAVCAEYGLPVAPVLTRVEMLEHPHFIARGVVTTDLDGLPLDLAALRGQAVLVVNVASKCGLTPQYTGLNELQAQFADQGFTVLGVPCNQFAGQEPGTAEEIQTFCSTTYGVSFPITEKVDVNGQRRHALFDQLVGHGDATGAAGDVQWNFEKFLVGPTGDVVNRFRPSVAPQADEVVDAIRQALPVWKKVSPSEVNPGDTVRARGQVVTVASIDAAFLGRTDMIALIVDTPTQWMKLPVPVAGEIEVLVAVE